MHPSVLVRVAFSSFLSLFSLSTSLSLSFCSSAHTLLPSLALPASPYRLLPGASLSLSPFLLSQAFLLPSFSPEIPEFFLPYPPCLATPDLAPIVSILRPSSLFRHCLPVPLSLPDARYCTDYITLHQDWASHSYRCDWICHFPVFAFRFFFCSLHVCPPANIPFLKFPKGKAVTKTQRTYPSNFGRSVKAISRVNSVPFHSRESEKVKERARFSVFPPFGLSVFRVCSGAGRDLERATGSHCDCSSCLGLGLQRGAGKSGESMREEEAGDSHRFRQWAFPLRLHLSFAISDPSISKKKTTWKERFGKLSESTSSARIWIQAVTDALFVLYTMLIRARKVHEMGER